jgi:hypothetical protein
VKAADGRMREGRPFQSTGELMNMGVTGEKGYYLLTSLAGVPRRDIHQRRVVDMRYATLQQPGK